jgi:hypothetical protein
VELAQALVHLVVEVLDEEVQVGVLREDLAVPRLAFVGDRAGVVHALKHAHDVVGPLALGFACALELGNVADLGALDLESALDLRLDDAQGFVARDDELGVCDGGRGGLRRGLEFNGHNGLLSYM